MEFLNIDTELKVINGGIHMKVYDKTALVSEIAVDVFATVL